MLSSLGEVDGWCAAIALKHVQRGAQLGHPATFAFEPMSTRRKAWGSRSRKLMAVLKVSSVFPGKA